MGVPHLHRYSVGPLHSVAMSEQRTQRTPGVWAVVRKTTLLVIGGALTLLGVALLATGWGLTRLDPGQLRVRPRG